MASKPKTNRRQGKTTAGSYDSCGTPSYALDPLFEYLDIGETIWEPAAGENLLADALTDNFYNVLRSDIITGQDFFEWEPEDPWSVIVTNPPYSIKYPWIQRCYDLEVPFALLIPVESIGSQELQGMMELYGYEIILLDKRVDFKMPDKGWEGSGAQFPVMWYTYGLGIGRDITLGKINKPKKTRKSISQMVLI